MMPKFEWDETKNESNKQKHKIPFEDATEVFKDNDRIQYINEIMNADISLSVRLFKLF